MAEMTTVFIYVMKYPNGILKVGYARSVECRRKELKNAGETLKIMRVWKMEYSYGRFVEKAAHDILRPYLAFRNEFYQTSLRKATEAVNLAFQNASHNFCLLHKRSFRILQMAVSPCRTKVLDCAKVTIIRRQKMWAEGRKLKLPVAKRNARKSKITEGLEAAIAYAKGDKSEGTLTRYRVKNGVAMRIVK